MSRKHSKHKREKTKSPSKKTKPQQRGHNEEKIKTELLSHCSGGSQLPQRSSLPPRIRKKRKLIRQEVDAPTTLKLSMEEQAESSWPRLSNSKEKHKVRLERCKDPPVQNMSASNPEKIEHKAKRKKKRRKRSHEENRREKHQSSTIKQAPDTYGSRHSPDELPWCEKCRSFEFCRHALKRKAMPSIEEVDLEVLKAKASDSSFECLQADFKDYFSKAYLQRAEGEHCEKDRNVYSNIKSAHSMSELTVSYGEHRHFTKEIENKEQKTSLPQLHKESNYSDIMHNCKNSGKDLRNFEELDSSKEKSNILVELHAKPDSAGKSFDVWKVTSAPLKAVKNTGNPGEGSKILESLIWEKCNKISNCLRGLRKKSKKLKQARNEFNIERASSQLSRNSEKPSDYSKSSGIEKPNIVSKEPTTSLSFSKKYSQSLRPCDDSKNTKLIHEGKGVSSDPRNHHLETTDSNLPQQSRPFERTDVSTLSSRSSEKTEKFETPKQTKKFHSFKILNKAYATDALSQTISKKLLSSSAAQSKSNSSDNATKATSIQQDHELFTHQLDCQRVSASTSASTTLPDHVEMDTDQKMEIAEELQTARYEKVLEVELGQSYGELTSMEIDPPQEIKILFSSEANSQSDILLVLDTNIFISHLNFIMNLKDHGVSGVSFPIIVIPWVVLQELDSLKNGKLSGGVNRKAIPAVQFIYSCFKSRHPHVWGQSMQQAAQKFCGLRKENNDDRVLQCCLQYQQLYPCAQVLLCSDDKNLCSKALVSGVKAVRKVDLLTELSDLKSTNHVPNTQDLSAFNQPQTVISVKELENGTVNQHLLAQKSALDVTGIICQLEKSLGIALSVILETEMKTVYDDLWTEILLVKPPWSLEDILLCLKKHWFAVFGLIVKRNLQSSVELLCDHFQADKRPEYNQFTLTWMLQESQKLLQAFSSRSDYGGVLPHALIVVDELLSKVSEDGTKNELTSKSSEKSEESSEKLEISAGPPLNHDSGRNVTLFPFNCNSGYSMSQMENSQCVSRSQQIWATFESVWNIINKYSSLIFATFNLPHNSLAVVIDNKLPLPEEAFQSLQRLMPAVKELLAGIQRILSSDSNVQDFQKLTEILHIFLNNDETNIYVTGISAQDLHECFTHEEYRKRLTVGYSQLAELTYSLEQCNAALCLEARNRGLV
ncbi:transcriptional protein SWT1 isoform X2 [Carcharodon carcharias]|uniref:transcriptional protein SWT1 isoform X2 n=1 Tax=Carcharodon carcharias TaxID=13397 RepID=UPI001B7F2CA3|nr:transcriptional protein SWT1 isoform X2 [Carcharodon carcharias]